MKNHLSYIKKWNGFLSIAQDLKGKKNEQEVLISTEKQTIRDPEV
jgi:hypothetical protein